MCSQIVKLTYTNSQTQNETQTCDTQRSSQLLSNCANRGDIYYDDCYDWQFKFLLCSTWKKNAHLPRCNYPKILTCLYIFENISLIYWIPHDVFHHCLIRLHEPWLLLGPITLRPARKYSSPQDLIYSSHAYDSWTKEAVKNKYSLNWTYLKPAQNSRKRSSSLCELYPNIRSKLKYCKAIPICLLCF